jgi:hypothetical protein
MMGLGHSQTMIVPCRVTIGQTAESLHAHMEMDSVAINPGDIVLLVDAPHAMDRSTDGEYHARAMVKRAGVLRQMLTRFAGLFQILELIEVGFEPKEVR